MSARSPGKPTSSGKLAAKGRGPGDLRGPPRDAGQGPLKLGAMALLPGRLPAARLPAAGRLLLGNYSQSRLPALPGDLPLIGPFVPGRGCRSCMYHGSLCRLIHCRPRSRARRRKVRGRSHQAFCAFVLPARGEACARAMGGGGGAASWSAPDAVRQSRTRGMGTEGGEGREGREGKGGRGRGGHWLDRRGREVGLQILGLEGVEGRGPA